MYIREIIPEKDHPTIAKWWEIKKVVCPLPFFLLPRGYMIEDAGIPIAAAFLYLDVDGKWAMTEWLSTNPMMAFSKSLVLAVRELLAHMEKVARERGCSSIISMVAPNTGEEHIMQKIGYTCGDGPAHKMYAKIIVKEGA